MYCIYSMYTFVYSINIFLYMIFVYLDCIKDVKDIQFLVWFIALHGLII